jgi:type I restriction enzyme M protein
MEEGRPVVPPAARLVRKLWQYCNVLRDDGLSYPDYVEQLTYLLFLKMADERSGGEVVPREYGWVSFAGKDAESLHRHYTKVLKHLSRQGGMLGLIFSEARNKIRDPAKLKVLVADLIGQSDWTGMSEDVKGDAYEGLLEKNAQDTKSGAGQYFTPRPLIDAIVACVRPAPGEVICDPACGTGGFLLAAHDFIRRNHPTLKPAQRRQLRNEAIRGVELVREVARLATMNLLLHGVGDPAEGAKLPIACHDSLASCYADRADVVLTNPPFGVKGSFVSTGEDGQPIHERGVVRKDFWVRTSNKQLNFLQHVYSMLKPGGRAAVVIPDNVLFEDGAAKEIRRQLLARCDLHTVLRLPTGIFYAHGVKANVLFFDVPKGAPAPPAGRKVWVYDLRSNVKFSLKSNPIAGEDLADFVARYAAGKRHKRMEPSPETDGLERWRAFDVAAVIEQASCSLDLAWTVEPVTSLVPATDRLRILASRVAGDLREALRQIELASVGLPEPQDQR